VGSALTTHLVVSKKAKDKRDLPSRIPKQLASNKIPFTKKRGERNTKVQPKMDKNQTRFFIFLLLLNYQTRP
jgi:hypothetical protein